MTQEQGRTGAVLSALGIVALRPEDHNVGGTMLYKGIDLAEKIVAVGSDGRLKLYGSPAEAAQASVAEAA